MRWELRYQRDGFSVEAARKKKRPLPADHWYNDRPPDVPGTDWFYEAYRDLATERHPDGPIPWSKTMAYADRKGVARDVAETLWAVIRRMDDAERAWRLDDIKSGRSGGVAV